MAFRANGMGDSDTLNTWAREAKLSPESRNSHFHSRHGIKVLMNDLRLHEADKLININSIHNEIISKSLDQSNQVACITALMILTVM